MKTQMTMRHLALLLAQRCLPPAPSRSALSTRSAVTLMQIESKLREFIIKTLYYAEDSPIRDEDSFLETGVVDSMGVMELVAYVQSEFGLEVAQEEIVVENFDSIRKLAAFVRRKLALKASEGSLPERSELLTPPS
jgi:acyl carrier protein